MSDLWAYCDPCGRWFYPGPLDGPGHSTSSCPVCSTQPIAYVDQSTREAAV